MVDKDQAILHIFRYDPERNPGPRYQRFAVPWKEGLTVLDALYHILDYQDPSLAFRASCREGVCGSCAMYIGGGYHLACQTLLGKGQETTVGPLPHLQVLRDLVVDMEPFFRHYESIMPYLMSDEATGGREHLQSPQQRRVLDRHVDCILCAACHSSCPLTWADDTFLGPAVLNGSYRFVADSRDRAGKQRLRLVDPSLWKCHTIFNCVEACPKDIPITAAIESLRRKRLLQRLKFWER